MRSATSACSRSATDVSTSGFCRGRLLLCFRCEHVWPSGNSILHASSDLVVRPLSDSLSPLSFGSLCLMETVCLGCIVCQWHLCSRMGIW
jgi:hypothetical protein